MRALAAGAATVGGVATLWACSGQCGRWAALGKRGADLLPAPASAARTGARKLGIDHIATPPTSPERTESSGEERAGAKGATPVVSDKSVDPPTEENHHTGQHDRHDRHEDSETLDDVAPPQRCRAPLSEETRVEWGVDKEGKQRELAPKPESAPGGPSDWLSRAPGSGSGSGSGMKREVKDETRVLAPREVLEDRVLESVGAAPGDDAGNTVDHGLQTAVDKSMPEPTDQTTGDSRNADHDQLDIELSQEKQPTVVGVDEGEDENENEEDRVSEWKSVDGDGGRSPSGIPKDSSLPRPPPLGRVAVARELFEAAGFASAGAVSALSMHEPVMDEKTRRSASLAIAFTQLRDDLTSIEADAVADRDECRLPDSSQPDKFLESSSDQKLATVPEHEASDVARDQCSSTCSSDSDADYTECIDDGRPHGTPTVVPWHPIEEAPPTRLGPDSTSPLILHRPQTSAFKRVG